MDEMRVYNEGGINWAWFTELIIHDNASVTIVKRYRLHKYEDKWPEKNLKAPEHPEYYHTRIWKENDERHALMYNVPGIGLLPIVNKGYIFDY